MTPAGPLDTRPTSVGLVMTSASRFFLIALARALKERSDCKIHVYCGTTQEVAFYNNANTDGVFHSVTNSEQGYRRQQTVSSEDLHERARRWERRLGCTFNSLAVGDRHFGRGYALAGPGHPRSRLSEAWTYEQMVQSYVSACEFWDNECKTRKLDLIINPLPLAVRVGRHHDVQCRTFFGSRYENLHYWGHDEFWTNPAVEEEYRRLESETFDFVSLTEPYFAERGFRKAYQRDASLSGLLRSMAVQVARQSYYRLRSYEKGNNYYLRSILHHLWRRWRDSRAMTSPKLATLSDIKGSPYIFFPLHTEPESSVGMLSPEYFYQHAAVAALSRDLPAGVRLAVKETIHGVGRRPRDFYSQVKDIKNVVWLNMMEHGVEVARHSLGVATITGTAGMEAAVMGKPVIVFGRHNHYGFLPHVFEIRDEIELKNHLAAIVEGGVDLARARVDGARYLQAVKNASFDMRDFNYLNLREFEPAAVDDAAEALLRSIARDGVATPQRARQLGRSLASSH
jgi:hypothetical protein